METRLGCRVHTTMHLGAVRHDRYGHAGQAGGHWLHACMDRSASCSGWDGPGRIGRRREGWWRGGGGMVEGWWRDGGWVVEGWWRDGGGMVDGWWRDGGGVVEGWWRGGGGEDVPVNLITSAPYAGMSHCMMLVPLSDPGQKGIVAAE